MAGIILFTTPDYKGCWGHISIATQLQTHLECAPALAIVACRQGTVEAKQLDCCLDSTAETRTTWWQPRRQLQIHGHPGLAARRTMNCWRHQAPEQGGCGMQLTQFKSRSWHPSPQCSAESLRSSEISE